MNVRAQVGHGAVIFDGAIRHQLLMAWKLIGLTPSWFVWLRFPFLIETWIILYHQCTLQGLYSHAFIMSNFKSRSGIGGLLRTSCDYPKHIIQMDCSHQPVWYWWFYAIIYIYTYKYEYIHIHIIWNILIYTYIHTWFLMFFPFNSPYHSSMWLPCFYMFLSSTPHGHAPGFCRSRDRLADDPKGGLGADWNLCWDGI